MIRHQDAAPHANLKRPAVIMAALAVLSIFSMFLALPAIAQEAPETIQSAPPASFVAGIRLMHDAHFYVISGLETDFADALVGIGFNNGFWLGAHARISLDDAGTVAGYGGLELTIVPNGERNDWRPTIPIGFVYRDGKLGAAMGARIETANTDEPVGVGFFIQFTYSIFTLGGE